MEPEHFARLLDVENKVLEYTRRVNFSRGRPSGR
jgi:hypothetical protein